ncbi:MAG TPA: PadR family transcriptional regulator [Solirubrobacteraceae bacterium]|jgi:DNA-binding PadR family transcriptional regulator|nr:PadR family transcriptional regulator [Solirubrobacteraceae bacterium]
MSTRQAVLGLLQQRDAYGYELEERLRSQLGPAWDLTSGHVSGTMKALVRDGLIEEINRATGGRGRRRVFAITESGAREHERWWADMTVEARLSRRPLLVKIALAGPDRLTEALAHIDAYEREYAEKLNELSRAREDVPSDAPIRADHVSLRLGLSADVIELEGFMRWLQHAREVVCSLQAREVIWPSRRGRSGPAGVVERDRDAARAEMFARMAARHLEPVPEQEGE